MTAVTALVVLTGPLPALAEDDPSTRLDSAAFLRPAAQEVSTEPWLRTVGPATTPRARITSLPGSDSAARIVAVVNVERARAGLAKLSVDPCLERWATSWSDRTAGTQTFGHQDLGGMIRDCGGREVGENIGTTTAPVETLMGAWMDSPGHRENILGRQWTSIGVGASRASDGTWYAAQEFLAR